MKHFVTNCFGRILPGVEYRLGKRAAAAVARHFIIPSIIIFHISHARYLSINFEIGRSKCALSTRLGTRESLSNKASGGETMAACIMASTLQGLHEIFGGLLELK